MRRRVLKTGTLLCLSAAVFANPLEGIGSAHTHGHDGHAGKVPLTPVPVAVHHHGHSHEAPPPEQPRDPREHHCSVDCLCKKADPNCPKPEVPVPTFAGWLESPEFAVTLTAPVSNRRVEPHPPPDLSGRQLRDHISSWLC